MRVLLLGLALGSTDRVLRGCPLYWGTGYGVYSGLWRVAGRTVYFMERDELLML